ncbi:MAG: MauE/DoxX family redox-associated membrane protein, partial [Acidimicrobiia bacterium]
AALLLVVGGLAKVRSPGDTARALHAVGIRAPFWAVRGGAALECAVGLGLLLVASPVFAALAALSYLAFTAFVVQALRVHSPLSTCGCFGAIDTPPSRVHVVIDVLVAISAATVAVVGTDVSLPTVLPDQPMAGVPFLMLVAIGTGLVFLAFSSLPRTLAAVREMQ